MVTASSILIIPILVTGLAGVPVMAAPLPLPAKATPVVLAQKDVAELVLRQGDRTKEITYRYEQNYFPVLQAYAVTDWKSEIKTGYSMDRTNNFLLIGPYEYDQYQTSASLAKSLLTGTTLSLQAARVSQRTNNLNLINSLPQLTLDTFSLQVEQALWNNSFGQGDRANIRRAEADYKSTMTLRTNELQQLVLSAISQFWNSYVAQENFRERLAARERYQKLVTTVRRKNSLGYANPGELSQVEAEFETAQQAVKSSSSDYLKNVDLLNTLLTLPVGTELKFNVPTALPPVPTLTQKPVEDLRVIRAQGLRLESAKEALNAAHANDRPTLNLVGIAGGSGLAATSDQSYSELTGGHEPKYYAGVRFAYNFGSGVLPEDIHAKTADVSLQQTVLERTRKEQQDMIADAERRVGSNYAIAQSSLREREFSERAVQELTRSYNQGRTDIGLLIQAMDKLTNNEVQTIRSLGDYEIALNQWAAARDELIPDQKDDKP